MTGKKMWRKMNVGVLMRWTGSAEVGTIVTNWWHTGYVTSVMSGECQEKLQDQLLVSLVVLVHYRVVS